MPRLKRSANKTTWPGRKQVWRRYGADKHMKDITPLEAPSAHGRKTANRSCGLSYKTESGSRRRRRSTTFDGTTSASSNVCRRRCSGSTPAPLIPLRWRKSCAISPMKWTAVSSRSGQNEGRRHESLMINFAWRKSGLADSGQGRKMGEMLSTCGSATRLFATHKND